MKNKEFKKLKHGDKLKCNLNLEIYIFDRYDKIFHKVYLGVQTKALAPINKKFFVKEFELIK